MKRQTRTVGSTSARLRVGTYTSKSRAAYFARRTSYDGERRATSTVLHCLIIATSARGLAQTRAPSYAQHGASTSKPARISAGERYSRRTIWMQR